MMMFQTIIYKSFLYKLGIISVIFLTTVHVASSQLLNKSVEFKNVIVKELKKREKLHDTVIVNRDSIVYRDTTIFEYKYKIDSITRIQTDSIFVKNLHFDSTCKCASITLDHINDSLVIINDKTYYKDTHKKTEIKMDTKI